MKSFRNEVGGEVRFSIPTNSPCPCRSGKAASHCCLTKAGFRKAPASTAPTDPTTDHCLESCYAAQLRDCSPKRSREHYISKSLLHYLNRNKSLTVGGLHWIEGEQQVLSPNALASKILCSRHNSALSPLDSIAVRLFEAFDETEKSDSGEQLLHLFSGHDIERWLLKTLCGIAASKNLTLGPEIDCSIPPYWLDILFGRIDFPIGEGLYICRSRGYAFEGPHGLRIQTITGKDRLTGMGLWVCGYELILSMSGFPSRTFDGRDFIYRPLELYTTGREFEKSVVMMWEGPADKGTVKLEIS